MALEPDGDYSREPVSILLGVSAAAPGAGAQVNTERAIEAFPFDADDSRRQPWVIFASEPAVVEELLEAADADPDVDPLAAGDGVLYWNPVKGTTVQTPFAKLIGKAKYKPVTTNRNLRTLQKILA